MKLLPAVFLCLFLGSNAFAQSEENNVNSAVGVKEIALTRGAGKAGETTDKFRTTDIPIFCLIQLDSEKPATVKMILIAVKAVGLRPETKIVTVNYKTKENQNQVNFTASPDGVWAAGDYRVDVYVDGKIAKSRTFTIEKSPKEVDRRKPTAPRKRNIKKPPKN
jgi:hypothetical protein